MGKKQPGASLLAALSVAERSRVLQQLLDAHPDLHDDAVALARVELTAVDPDAVANQVMGTYLGIGFQAIASRVGHRRGHGYVHEADATVELLSETLEPFASEITRRSALGFDQAAVDYARGIIAGLRRLRDTAGEETLIGWGDTQQNIAELGWTVAHALEKCGIDPQQTVADLWDGRPL